MGHRILDLKSHLDPMEIRWERKQSVAGRFEVCVPGGGLSVECTVSVFMESADASCEVLTSICDYAPPDRAASSGSVGADSTLMIRPPVSTT